MRAIIRYPGAKWRIADWIIEHFPSDYEKMVYLEPFAGSGAVFFNKLPGCVETLNDMDGDVVNLFRILRERPGDLKHVLELTPYSREEYNLAFEPCEDPLERARRFMVRTTQAIGAKMDGKCGWRNHKQTKIGGTACKWNGIPDTIDAAAKRLKGDTTHLVQIERMDALRLIRRYNTPEALIYLDPPYMRSTRKSGRLYRFEMTDDQHQEMLELITHTRAKVVVSGYVNDLYAKYLSEWNMYQTETHTTSAEVVKETIWTNYSRPMRQMSFEDALCGDTEGGAAVE